MGLKGGFWTPLTIWSLLAGKYSYSLGRPSPLCLWECCVCAWCECEHICCCDSRHPLRGPPNSAWWALKLKTLILPLWCLTTGKCSFPAWPRCWAVAGSCLRPPIHVSGLARALWQREGTGQIICGDPTLLWEGQRQGWREETWAG